MKNYAGVWIDHGRAVVVSVTAAGEKTILIQSDCQRRVQAGAGLQREKGTHGSEDKRDRRFLGHLDHYYDKVISLVQGADSILLLGPGEAKGELRKRLDKTARPGRAVVVETNDKMTDRQVAARVRQFAKAGDAPGSSMRDDVNRSFIEVTRSRSMNKAASAVSKQKKPAAPGTRAERRRAGPRTQHFQVKAPPGSEVFLVGSFNGWNVTANRMRQNGQELYVADVELLPGHHEYKFLVNGQWQMDHERAAWAQNPFGSLNSVLELAESGK